jgi:5'-3' exoribonuclease 1
VSVSSLCSDLALGSAISLVKLTFCFADNLYLDLNGIVHNCIHGNDPKRHERISRNNDLEEVWASVMQAIDELIHTIKPQKVLLLAVDGVAPRAKMNQ